MFFKWIFHLSIPFVDLIQESNRQLLQIELDLKGVHEWLQIKESTMSKAKLYTTIDEMEVSSSTISQIGMDAQNKRLFFDPLKFSAVNFLRSFE